jgi:hypothetical protein
MEFRIQQRADIWYETTIEADTFEEAVIKAYEDYNLDWSSLPESVEFRDEFWGEDEDGNEYSQREG